MKYFFAFLISAVALAVELPEPSGKVNLRVKTLSGEIDGYLGKSCREGTTFAGFRGIPYAEPPVGELRFKNPIPKAPWTGVWNGTYQRSSCLQGSSGALGSIPGMSNFSEDCLYLNVYTTNLKYLEDSTAPLKAVMVFIHMGAFIMGSSDEALISPDFLLDQDVVVATFNYRLGALGFLTLQNADVPGNAGLKDQNLALKWVKANIESFGGDPDRITIFGESAGSASVNYHLLSPASAGLFNGAIMESGTAITPWAYSPPDLALRKSRKLGRKVGCNIRNTDKLLECLQKVPAERFPVAQQKALTLEEIFTLRIIAFHPTSEPDLPGAFITENPFDIMYSGNFTKVPTIIGSNSDEGLLIYPALVNYDPSGLLVALVGMDLSRFAPYNFHLKPFSKLAVKVHQQISQFYFNGKTVTKQLMTNLLELVTDTMFVVPIQLTASFIADTLTPVYNYEFTYDGSYGLGKISSALKQISGVCHGDEIGYLFYNPAIHPNCGLNVSEAAALDELMINRMTKMWTNFAKTGKPTPQITSEIPVVWEPFTSIERTYLNIGKDLVPSDSFKLARMMFWEDIITQLINERDDPADTTEEDDDDYYDLD